MQREERRREMQRRARRVEIARVETSSAMERIERSIIMAREEWLERFIGGFDRESDTTREGPESSNKSREKKAVNIDDFTCKVCNMKEIDYVFLSCGHLSCESCKNKTAMNCPICGSEIKKAQKLFI